MDRILLYGLKRLEQGGDRDRDDLDESSRFTALNLFN